MIPQKLKDSAKFIALIAFVGRLIAVIVELHQTQATLRAPAYRDPAFDAIEWHMEISNVPRLTARHFEQDGFHPKEISTAEYESALQIVVSI